jgi:all-trans-retinol 13,14-reductase
MARLGTSLKQQPPRGKFDAIVIGSGIGGLCCAALLSRAGHRRVLVLERHYRLGGYTHTFERPGYEWDVGLHYVGEVGEGGPMRHVFDRLSDGRLKWVPMPEVYDSIELGERRYPLVAGAERFLEHLGKAFPRSQTVLARYLALVRAVAGTGAWFLGPRGLPTVLAKAISWVAGRGYANFARRTTWEVLRELTDDEELLGVLTGQWGDVGLPPRRSSFVMHAGVVNHYLGGGFYPAGGSAALAQSIAPLIEENGGQLVVGAEVAEIIVRDGRAVGVRLTNNEVFFAPRIISDAGAAVTFGRLLPPQARPRALVRALEAVGPSSSYLGLYLGYDAPDAALGLTGTNLWLYPDAHHDQNVERFEADPEAPFPVVYCSFPSAKDPDFQRRHPGHATIDVITMARWDQFSAWQHTRWGKRGEGYDVLKEKLSARLLAAVEARLPQLRGRAAHVELSTPLSAAHFAGHPQGELYGLAHTPARYALPLRAHTPVAGLLLTGSDLVNCGVAGALAGGLLTAGAVLGPGPVFRLLRPPAARTAFAKADRHGLTSG